MEKKLKTYGLKYEDMSMDVYDRLMSDLEKIENVSELDEEQVAKLKEKMKQIEGTLKDKIKPKTITISGNLHSRIKKHCSDNNYSIGDWSEMALNKEMNYKPKRVETNLIQYLEEYRVKLTKNVRLSDILRGDIDDTVNVNKVNDVILMLRNQGWEERERLRTIKLNLNPLLKDFNTDKMEDYLHRKFPKNQFIMNITSKEISEKLNKLQFGVNSKFIINEKGEVTFREYLSLSSPNLYKKMVFEFDENTFDLEMPFECQIKNIFGVDINRNDYYLTPVTYL